MRNTHCRTWNMASIIEKRKKENKHCRTWKMARKLKNVENDKQKLYNLEYGDTTAKRGK
jgi:hypothetical protein